MAEGKRFAGTASAATNRGVTVKYSIIYANSEACAVLQVHPNELESSVTTLRDLSDTEHHHRPKPRVKWA